MNEQRIDASFQMIQNNMRAIAADIRNLKLAQNRSLIISKPGNFTPGAMLFGSDGGRITQDPTKLFWDNTNNRFGIGTNAPATELEVIGGGRFSSQLDVGTGNTASGDNTYLRCTLSAATGGKARIDAFRSGVGATDILIGTVFASNVGIGTTSPGTLLDVAGVTTSTLSDAATSATNPVMYLAHNSSGTPVANFGAAIRFRLKTSTTNNRDAGQVDARWTVATEGSQRGRISIFSSDNTGFREGLRIDTNGSAALIGFFGGTGAAKQTITGTRTGTLAQLQTVVANILTAGANYGFWTDSTT